MQHSTPEPFERSFRIARACLAACCLYLAFLLFFGLADNALAEDKSRVTRNMLSKARELLGVHDLQVDRIDVPAILEGDFTISVHYEGEEYHTQLERRSVLSDRGAKQIHVDENGVIQRRPLRPATLFWAHPSKAVNSRAITRGTFRLLNGGLLGSLEISEVDAFGNEIEGTSERVFLSPARYVLSNTLSRDLHFVYSTDDLVASADQMSCEVHEHPVDQASAGSVPSISREDALPTPINSSQTRGANSSEASSCMNPVPPYVEGDVTVVADYCYWATLPGTSAAQKQALASEIIQQSVFHGNLPFEPLGIDLRLQLIYFEATPVPDCSTPSGLLPGTVLQNLQSLWPSIASYASPITSFTMAFLGQQWADPFSLGYAYGPALHACNSNYFFAAADYSRTYGETSTVTQLVRRHHLDPVVSHELAHLMNVPHCTNPGIITPFCGLMTTFGVNLGMPSGTFDPNSAEIIECNKSASCLLPVSPPIASLPIVPDEEHFDGMELDDNTWSSGLGYSFPGNGTIRLSGSYSTQTYETAYIASRRLRLPMTDPYDPAQLLVRLTVPKVATQPGTVLNLEILDRTFLWRNVLKVRPGELPNGASAELAVKVPVDTIHQHDFRIRVAVDLAAGDSVEIDKIEFTTRNYRKPAGINPAHQVVIGDLNSDGIDELIVSEPNGFNGIGQVHIYSGDLYFAKRILTGPQGWSFGSSVAVVPDLNGDGYPELAVGITGGLNGVQLANPRVEFFRGQDLVSSSGTPQKLPQILRSLPDIGFPADIRSIRDMDGDDVADLFVGAPEDLDNAGVQTGSVHLFSGRSGQLLHRVSGIASGDRFGCSIDTADETSFFGLNGKALLLVGTCGPAGSFRYTRLFDASFDSTYQLPIVRTDSEAAIAPSLPGVSGDSRFGQTVKFTPWKRGLEIGALIGLPGTRYDSSGAPVSAGAIYRTSILPTGVGELVSVGEADDFGYGTSIGVAALWEQRSNGIASGVSKISSFYPGSRQLQIKLLRDGFEEIVTFKTDVALNGQPTLRLAMGDLDGDQQTDFALGGKVEGCPYPIGCSDTVVYLSSDPTVSEPSGAGLGSYGPKDIFARVPLSLLSASIPDAGASSGVITFNARNARTGSWQVDFLFVGSSIENTSSLGGVFEELFGENRPLVLPEFTAQFPVLPVIPGFPTSTTVTSTDPNIAPVKTLSFDHSGQVSGVYYHQIVSLIVPAAGVELRPGNIIRINYG